VSIRPGDATTARPIELPYAGPADLDTGEITFIGTATVLLRYGGFTILTDPNFLHQGEHARLGYGLRSRRLTEPALSLDELPPVDFVVLSHHHGDHFDDRVVRELDADVPIITTPQAARKLSRQGFRQAFALSTWESQLVVRNGDSVRVTALPGRHGPGAVEWLLPPVMGSMLEFGAATRLRVYITGDTLVHDRLAEIPRRYPDIDLSLLHLGGTRIMGILLTMDADQGVEALRTVRPRHAIPIHYDDYTVFRSPLDDFRIAAEHSGLTTAIHYLDRGDTFRFRTETVR
jgi:L-ascorbate metabolism protein UlaG (beta-lactamase superfamily)